jgi:hypothetical protein
VTEKNHVWFDNHMVFHMTHHLRGPRYSSSCQYPILKPNCNMYTHSYLKYKQKLMYFVQIRIKYIWLCLYLKPMGVLICSHFGVCLGYLIVIYNPILCTLYGFYMNKCLFCFVAFLKHLAVARSCLSTTFGFCYNI